MAPLSTESVRAAIAQTVEHGGWFLSFPNADSGAWVMPAALIIVFGGLLLALHDYKSSSLKSVGFLGLLAGAVACSVLTLWTGYFKPLNPEVAESAQVIMAANAYLFDEPVSEDPPSHARLLDARYRVRRALSEADYMLKKICLAGGPLCPDGKQSLATSQLVLALAR